MSLAGRLVCGIDIGSDSVRAVLARIPEEAPGPDGTETIEIIAAGQAPAEGSVQYGEVVRIEGVADAVRAAIEEVEEAAGIEVRSAYVAVGTRNRRAINSSGEATVLDENQQITRRDVARAVRTAIPSDRRTSWLRPPYQLLHALPQEFWVDDFDATDDPTGWTGRHIQSFVHLIACPRPTLERIEKSVNAIGVEVEKFVIAPLASGIGVLRPEERQGDVLLLDIGAMTTDIAVFRRGALWHSDVMPSGGSAYTNDVASGLQTRHSEAERIKCLHGSALVESVPETDLVRLEASNGTYPRRVLAHIIQHRAESTFTKIRDQLRQALSTGIPHRLVLTGGGARLDGLSEVARLVFGVEAESRGPDSLGGPLLEAASHPRFGCAVGLARFALKEEARRGSRRLSSLVARMKKVVGGR